MACDQSGLHVIDVTNPAAPRRVGGYSGNNSALRVAVSGEHVFLADGAIQILDVSDPAAPRRVGDDGLSGDARAVAVAGDYAYLADNNAGLRVLSLADALECRLCCGQRSGTAGD